MAAEVPKVSLGDASDIKQVLAVDHLKRRMLLLSALREKHCLVARIGNQIVGFLIWNERFFERPFISHLVVLPEFRKSGIASGMFKAFRAKPGRCDIFSSTNRSNRVMKKVFAKWGFQKVGVIDGLDEGDPELIYRLKL